MSNLMNNHNNSWDMMHKFWENCLEWSNEKNIDIMEWNKEKKQSQLSITKKETSYTKMLSNKNDVTAIVLFATVPGNHWVAISRCHGKF